jgi:hypothetical protein
MGARGPHDDFETAEKQARAAYASFNETQDAEELRRTYVSPELEYVTRHGTFHGPDRLFNELEVQHEKWRLENEIEEILDAGEGAMILLLKINRVDNESGEVVWKAWPAVVLRIKDGKCVFFEGYIDRRQALADFGVQG